jgi:hypothetical protein
MAAIGAMAAEATALDIPHMAAAVTASDTVDAAAI